LSIAVAVLTLVLLAVVIAVVSRPLLAARKPPELEVPRQEDLTAAREAKYKEIRDAELDYRTGKLSREDYEAVNATLRAEAIEILDQLEALDERQDSSTRVS
jgi:type II secretory pathway component PulM